MGFFLGLVDVKWNKHQLNKICKIMSFSMKTQSNWEWQVSVVISQKLYLNLFFESSFIHTFKLVLHDFTWSIFCQCDIQRESGSWKGGLHNMNSRYVSLTPVMWKLYWCRKLSKLRQDKNSIWTLWLIWLDWQRECAQVRQCDVVCASTVCASYIQSKNHSSREGPFQ